jgi:hypothetical protein
VLNIAPNLREAKDKRRATGGRVSAVDARTAPFVM